jgi:exopolysaccharide production protein ExoZ
MKRTTCRRLAPKMNNQNNSRDTLKNIQAIRFIAALWVFLLHFRGTPLFQPSNATIGNFINMGFAGVDIFFVISGYIMALTLKDVAPSPAASWHFISKRFIRIYSGWWPLFFCYWAFYSIQHQISSDMHLIGSFFLAPLYLQQYLVGVTWTLSFELYFYTCLTLLLIFAQKSIARILLFAGLLIIAYGIYSRSQGIFTPEGVANANRIQNFYGYVLILEFIAGYLLAHNRRLHKWPIIWIASTVFIGLGTTAYLYQNSEKLLPSGLAGFYHAPERVLLVGGAACCLVFLADQIEQRNWRSPLWLQRLGDASYSLYLVHILCIGILNLVAPTILKITPINLQFCIPFFCIITTVLCSLAIHKFIEKPLTKILNACVKNISIRFQSKIN